MFDLHHAESFLAWRRRRSSSIKLQPDKTYVRPSGYKVRMEKPAARTARWRLVGTVAEGSLVPQALHGFRRRQIGNLQADHRRDSDRAGFRREFKKDFDHVAELIQPRLQLALSRSEKSPTRGPCLRRNVRSARSSNCSRRTSANIKPDYNAWLESVPQYIKELVFVVKRYYKPEWGDKLARTFQRGHHQRQAGQRIEMRQSQAGHHAICASALTPTAPGARSACARIFIRP